MTENVFEVVKKSVAEQYGIEVTQSGMTKSPFHSDQFPSLKLNNRYYCFRCGATGDVIDFVARLFQIGSKEAAEKIVSDFGVSYDKHIPRVLPKRTTMVAQIQKHGKQYAYSVLINYYRQLQEWLVTCALHSPEDDIDPRYLEGRSSKGL